MDQPPPNNYDCYEVLMVLSRTPKGFDKEAMLALAESLRKSNDVVTAGFKLVHHNADCPREAGDPHASVKEL